MGPGNGFLWVLAARGMVRSHISLNDPTLIKCSTLMKIPKTTAVILTSGIGSRFMPAAKAINKCMLPLGNKPILQYLVEECVNAGITDIIISISPDDVTTPAHFQVDDFLNLKLKSSGKESIYTEHIASVERLGAYVRFCVTNDEMCIGTAVPLWDALSMVSPSTEQLLIMNGDAVIYHGSDVIGELKYALEKRQNAEEGILFGFEVNLSERHHYGVLLRSEENPEYVVGLLEKPNDSIAPNSLVCNLGWYLAPVSIIPHIKNIQKDDKTGEYLLTDAFAGHLQEARYRIHSVSGERYLDCGRPEAWLAANNFIASRTSQSA